MSQSTRSATGELTAFVLAGGFGTRLRSTTGEVAKVLAPIDGRPFLCHLLDWLEKNGIRRVLLSLGHLADQVIFFVRSNPRETMQIDCVVEPEPLGTGGAIAYARHALDGDPVLVLNGDSLADADLEGFVAQHVDGDHFASILCATVTDAADYGRIETDEAGYVVNFHEKDPTFQGAGLVSCGVYLFSSDCLDHIAAENPRSLEEDYLCRLEAETLYCNASASDFIDIGTAERFAWGQKRVPEIAGNKHKQTGRA
ncbi:sugar phosphate nucleotidyltransferase [Nisaea sp.]|uniref:sugar phosphate nucleotidyltransferase n=1 Tax=Nisaea sp. TaxID=2024842 RepID=UPI0032EE827F